MSDSELALLGRLIGDGCTLPTHAIQYTSSDEDLAHSCAELASEVFGDAGKPASVASGRGFRRTSRHADSGRRRNPVAAWLDELGAFGLAELRRRLSRTRSSDRTGRESQLPPASLGHRRMYRARRRISDAALRLIERGSSTGCPVALAPPWDLSVRPRDSRWESQAVRCTTSLCGRQRCRRFLARRHWEGKAIKIRSCTQLPFGLPQWQSESRDTIPADAWRVHRSTRDGAYGIDTSNAPLVTSLSSHAAALRSTPAESAVNAPRLSQRSFESRSRALASSDVYWDEIAAVEADGEEEVFDLTVDGLHSFVAENVIVHNSIEQDADLVMFLYRDEYYNENSEDQGLAEVILAKHRNGPIGTEKLAFLKRYAKFSDLAPNHDARVAAA